MKKIYIKPTADTIETEGSLILAGSVKSDRQINLDKFPSDVEKPEGDEDGTENGQAGGIRSKGIDDVWDD